MAKTAKPKVPTGIRGNLKRRAEALSTPNNKKAKTTPNRQSAGSSTSTTPPGRATRTSSKAAAPMRKTKTAARAGVYASLKLKPRRKSAPNKPIAVKEEPLPDDEHQPGGSKTSQQQNNKPEGIEVVELSPSPTPSASSLDIDPPSKPSAQANLAEWTTETHTREKPVEEPAVVVLDDDSDLSSTSNGSVTSASSGGSKKTSIAACVQPNSISVNAVAEAEEKIQQLKELLDAKTAESAALLASLDTLRKVTDDMQAELDKAQSTTAQSTALPTKLEAIQSELGLAKEDNDSLRKETTTLRKEKQELVEALAKCSAADEQLLLALADAENLRKENEKLRQDASEQLRVAATERDELQQRFDTQAGQLKEAGELLNSVQEKLKQAEEASATEVADIQRRWDKQRAETTSEMEQVTQRWKSRVEELEEDKARQIAKLENAKSAYEALKAEALEEKRKSNAELVAMRLERDNAKSELKSSAEVERQKKQLSAKLKKSEAKVSELNEFIEQLKAQIQKYQDAIQSQSIIIKHRARVLQKRACVNCATCAESDCPAATVPLENGESQADGRVVTAMEVTPPEATSDPSQQAPLEAPNASRILAAEAQKRADETVPADTHSHENTQNDANQRPSEVTTAEQPPAKKTCAIKTSESTEDMKKKSSTRLVSLVVEDSSVSSPPSPSSAEEEEMPVLTPADTGTSVQAAIPPSSSCASATGSSPSTASPAANDEQDDVLFVEERQGTHDESRPTLTAVLKDLKQEDTVLPAALLAAMESTDSPLIPLDMGSLQSPSDRNNQAEPSSHAMQPMGSNSPSMVPTGLLSMTSAATGTAYGAPATSSGLLAYGAPTTSSGSPRIPATFVSSPYGYPMTYPLPFMQTPGGPVNVAYRTPQQMPFAQFRYAQMPPHRSMTPPMHFAQRGQVPRSAAPSATAHVVTTGEPLSLFGQLQPARNGVTSPATNNMQQVPQRAMPPSSAPSTPQPPQQPPQNFIHANCANIIRRIVDAHMNFNIDIDVIRGNLLREHPTQTTIVDLVIESAMQDIQRKRQEQQAGTGTAQPAVKRHL
ncbi:Filamin A-interacting protein 1-like protein [Aphelenchoides avenae]|nr:Filamin A-interacting protein 1-like protein [Aphelenchus avenae]